MLKNGMRPVHPGEMLREEYLEPLHIVAELYPSEALPLAFPRPLA
jgi:antitoxin HigA-1